MISFFESCDFEELTVNEAEAIFPAAISSLGRGELIFHDFTRTDLERGLGLGVNNHGFLCLFNRDTYPYARVYTWLESSKCWEVINFVGRRVD
jgi:hypothetical protein